MLSIDRLSITAFTDARFLRLSASAPQHWLLEFLTYYFVHYESRFQIPSELGKLAVPARRTEQGDVIARPIAGLPLTGPQKKRVLLQSSLHFDATRSASLFAGRLILVQGLTDALFLRKMGHAWSADDAGKRDFIDALTIVPMGSRVGE
jgi:hypothetical protein